METLNNQWISISDYANEYQVSISTLRRRIKAQQVPYKMMGGKYYLSPPTAGEISTMHAMTEYAPVPKPALEPRQSSPDVFSQRELIEELKKAYMSSLHDKEEQILTLKQQIADLKTLVMFLEKEVSRVKSEF